MIYYNNCMFMSPELSEYIVRKLYHYGMSIEGIISLTWTKYESVYVRENGQETVHSLLGIYMRRIFM